MEKRRLDQLGIEVSLLGFGCMRFPTLADGKIDEAEAEKMIDYAIEKGVNYIDTAYPYHNGDSEPFVGRVLNKYKRSSYYLATKLPCWNINSVEDAKKKFYEQLERLQKDYVDFYLLHALNSEKWNKMVELGVVAFCEQLKEEGKIKYLGFSFHDDYKVFEEIITYRSWDFCQIQFNYMDTQEQAGIKGYELTEKLGIPLIIMEPVKGGALANYPSDIVKIFHSIDETKSVASWALRWVGTFPNVKVILSGMSTMDQVLDNLDTFEDFKVLDKKEQEIINQVVDTLHSRVKNGCTGCGYCMPCPAGVDIPRNFAIWNKYHVYGDDKKIKQTWMKNFEQSIKAGNCIECGKCESVCPQQLSIRNDLKQVQADLDQI